MAAKPRKSADILDAVALLVVDMQGPFLDVIEGSSTVVERCGFAIEAARVLGLRVVFTEQVPEKLGRTEPRLRALLPQARVFPKNTFSALQAEGLVDYLRRQGIYHLVLAGIEIPVCIYQTALHAVDSDFDVTVLSDCVTGRRLDDCLVTLEALTRAHVHVLPAESVFYSMLGHAGHPRFPAYNALVKRYSQPGALDAAPPPPEPVVRSSRPELAAPEDRADSPDQDELEDFPEEAAEGDEERGDGDDEDASEAGTYFGHEAEERGGVSRGSTDGGAEGDDEESSEGDDEGEDDEDTADLENEDGAAANSEGGYGGAERPGRRRRGRRRRGGARRRRARERERERSATGQAPGATESGDAPREGENHDSSGERRSEPADEASPPAENGETPRPAE